MNRDTLKEKIIETNYYLTQAIIMSNIKDIDRLRVELNKLIELYKTELTKNVF